MNNDAHPLKQAVIELGTWVDRWRDEPGLETLVDAVREAWMDYVTGSAMLSSPRDPSITIRIFSSAENRRRVFLRISRTAFSADSLFSMVPSPFGARNPLLDHWTNLSRLG
jgi:hypothetical protein